MKSAGQRIPDVRFDRARNYRAKIGFVVIPNEQTIEGEMMHHMPDGVGAYFSRALMPREISTQNLSMLGEGLAEEAARILPDDKLDVICFACTSGTVAVGEQRSCDELRKGAPGAKTTTLMGAVVAGLQAFGVGRLAVATPYADELNANVANHLTGAGFDVVNLQGLGLTTDTDMIRVSPSYLVEYAKAVDVSDAEAVLISCGALRTIEVVDEIEQQLGKPVICSNQAMLWHCLRLAGVEDRISGLGQLLAIH